MSREEVKKQLIALIEPLVENLGFELVLLEYIVGKHGKIHLIIDHDNGISVEDCALVSRSVSELLDLNDPLAHAYSLEVSSPGLERPLTKKEHFRRFTGEKVKIKTADSLNGENKFCGRLDGTLQDHIIIRKDDESSIEIPYEIIAKANLWFTKPEKNKFK